eukprot:CAMPEP_0197174198 /NCGR_PEP_ID=MMETSP1423-20130617/825_1 /TAXON_ID=476441 /ORGANISM="Pseudo-nitzschia heimii, Strain UNC1101" /LENGTH=428 /DNA_ID=CAMNT_0042623101 /DNA_START=127 /DNA_END=1413 /DNA_ORIENTATION=+
MRNDEGIQRFQLAIISSLVVAICTAGSTSIFGWEWQFVDAFKVNPTNIHHVPYQYKQYQYQKDRLCFRISGGQVDFCRKIDVQPIRGSHKLLQMSSGDGDDKSSSSSTQINTPLILRNLGNQALIGYQIWNGGNGFTVLSEQTHFGAVALILAIVGVIPMLALSRAIETSESPYVSGLNLSTNMAVLRLFGPTPRPISAFLISLLMATTTGIAEETLFRGQCLPAFAFAYGNGDVLTGAFLSTLLFAVLHTNPLSFFKGMDAFLDNFALLILQIINGAIFTVLYVFTGNLAVPIITHALYDLYTFYKTHIVDVAGQMDYAEVESLMPICTSTGIEKKWVAKYGEDWLKEAKESFFLMDTNRDGKLSRKELRIALYSYGINLSKLESEAIEQAVDTDGSGSIDFDEYLEFIGPTGSRYKAVRNTLLGPT